jgi:hypothetical protein
MPEALDPYSGRTGQKRDRGQGPSTPGVTPEGLGKRGHKTWRDIHASLAERELELGKERRTAARDARRARG